jgi:hypothetical protein
MVKKPTISSRISLPRQIFVWDKARSRALSLTRQTQGGRVKLLQRLGGRKIWHFEHPVGEQ